MIKALKNYQTEFTESKIYNCRREAKCSLPFDYCIYCSRIRRYNVHFYSANVFKKWARQRRTARVLTRSETPHAEKQHYLSYLVRDLGEVNITCY